MNSRSVPDAGSKAFCEQASSAHRFAARTKKWPVGHPGKPSSSGTGEAAGIPLATPRSIFGCRTGRGLVAPCTPRGARAETLRRDLTAPFRFFYLASHPLPDGLPANSGSSRLGPSRFRSCAVEAAWAWYRNTDYRPWGTYPVKRAADTLRFRGAPSGFPCGARRAGGAGLFRGPRLQAAQLLPLGLLELRGRRNLPRGRGPPAARSRPCWPAGGRPALRAARAAGWPAVTPGSAASSMPAQRQVEGGGGRRPAPPEEQRGRRQQDAPPARPKASRSGFRRSPPAPPRRRRRRQHAVALPGLRPFASSAMPSHERSRCQGSGLKKPATLSRRLPWSSAP